MFVKDDVRIVISSATIPAATETLVNVKPQGSGDLAAMTAM
jgi:hypothetical protein